ncbi:MAG: family 10 glycosylhydrolase [Phycisphaerae bacterium]|nr:family 10 glycosylhydrolase [Phycisphaerae bacterium]
MQSFSSIRMSLCAAVAALTLTISASAQTSFRAFWADAFSPGYKNASEVNSMISRALAARYNAIIVEVVAFHDNVGVGHGAYYNSTILPKATDIASNFDPLATVIAQAHANNIEVHAWIVPYRVSSVWPPSGNALLTANPQWLMAESANIGAGPTKIGGSTGYFTLDPGSPDAQEYLTSIVRELVTNYQIDGINLDYIRYVQTNAGYPASNSYTNSGLQRFRDLTGFVGTPPSTGNTAWNDFRRQTIDEYVRRLRAEIPSITSNPRQPLRYSADLICFGNAPASFTSSDPYNLFSNWRMWMEQGWLDMAIPMNYKREHVSNEATWYRNWVNSANTWTYNRHFVAGQGNYLNTMAGSVAQLSYALNNGADGICTFSYDATADQNTNGTPEADWTWYTAYLPTNLFTTTATPPTMPWRNPATATEGTLWGRVTDAATDAPIDGATVQVGALPAVKTDGNGYYVVTLVPAGASGTAYNIAANAPGCPISNANNILVTRAGLTRRDFHVCPTIDYPGDMDNDGDVDGADMNLIFFCFRGPDFFYAPGNFCLNGDADTDTDMDMMDLAEVQQSFGN